MNIYLIGMPGSGKSTIGKKISKQLNMDFVDLDEYIQTRSAMFIDEIFSAYGEKYFRDLETNCLQELMHKENTVISCGGGVVVKEANKGLMKGKIIYLMVSINDLKRRLEKAKLIRPLLKTKTVEELFEERNQLYLNFADIVINNQNVDKSIEKIKNGVGQIMDKVLVINGPNINMLGKRPKDHYGDKTLEEINQMMVAEGGFLFEFFQSNHEGAIVDKIQQSLEVCGVIINPGAFTHTSIAIHDALEILECPIIEVHLSDVDNREDFRKINYIRSVCQHSIKGLKEMGYIEAIKYLKRYKNMI